MRPDSPPSELEARRTSLTTTDLVNLALERSPETHAKGRTGGQLTSNLGSYQLRHDQGAGTLQIG